MDKTVKIIKKTLGKFFSHLQALSVKIQKKVMNGFRDKALHTHGRTYGRTDATPKVSTTSWSRDQKCGKMFFKQAVSRGLSTSDRFSHKEIVKIQT